MPYLESVDDLAESLANLLGLYGSCNSESEEDCPKDCRSCFVFSTKQRIREAVANERLLSQKGSE